MTAPKHFAVIGAGPMGLMTTYRLLQQGHQATLFEADDRIGGMSASFDFNGVDIERFYHFICATDQPLFDLLKELELEKHLRWTETKMGYYYQGKMYSWGGPFGLLKFPHLSWKEKFNYSRFVMSAVKTQDWKPLDKITAKKWVTDWIGPKAYDVLWESLFKYKFYQYKDDLSAAWLGTRIQRVGLSRKNIFTERMGYLEGGSAVLLDKLAERINALGGNIELNARVKGLIDEAGTAKGLIIGEQAHHFDGVISTIPLPYVNHLAPSLPAVDKAKIAGVENVGVRCVLVKCQQAFSPYFWMNINDQRMQIPGIIEYTNLNPGKASILYVPYYMPSDHEKYQNEDSFFVTEVMNYLKMINPNFDESWVLDTHVARYAYSQTVCTPNFYEQLPPMRSAIKNFYMADTSYYYPEDRSISESVLVGDKLATLAHEDA